VLTCQRLLGLGIGLLLLLIPVAPARAAGGAIYGVCSDAVCRVKVKTGAKRVLLRGGSSRPYRAVSVDRAGRRLAFIRGEEVFRARAGGRSRQRIGTALRQAAPEVHVRPDGGAVAWIDVLQRPDLISGGVYYERNLLSLSRGSTPGGERIVATDMLSAGWLGSKLMRQAFGEAGAPWFACTVTAAAGCVRSVAVDATRFLDQPAGSTDGRRVAAVALPAAPEGNDSSTSGPIALFDAASGRRLRDVTTGADSSPAFSPDGRTIAFVRGRDLYTVPARGGRARRLARGVESPAWARR
jgi:hypothetical protein